MRHREARSCFAAIAATGFLLQACAEAPEPPAQRASPSQTNSPVEQVDSSSLLAEVAARQNIEVSWSGGPHRYVNDVASGWADDPPADEIAKAAEAIARELRLYPAGFLQRAGFQSVVLVRNLQVTEDGGTRGAAGYIFDGRFLLDVPSALRAIEAGTRVRFIHHVVWHQLDERAGTMWTDPEWVALNPAQFEYGVHSRGGVHEKRAGAGKLTTEFPGFLNLYSTGNLPDDKAEVFAYLMVVHSGIEERANRDRYLRGKIAMVKQRLAALDPSFDAAFWERIDGHSDIAARYGL